MQKSKISFFMDEYVIYSNFYPATIEFEDKIYPTVEHAYVAAKTKNDDIRLAISQLRADEAGKAKKLGRKVKLRPDWEKVKVEIMKKLVRQKFNKQIFKDHLLSTNNAYIEEGNYWHDNFWGNCHCPNCSNIEGKNMLGKILMEIRLELKGILTC